MMSVTRLRVTLAWIGVHQLSGTTVATSALEPATSLLTGVTQPWSGVAGLYSRAVVNMIADILPYLQGRSFDADTLRAMGDAYEAVMRKLPKMGQAALVREVVANRIIDIGEKGERDLDELARRALKELGISAGSQGA
jgi:hypothetical protein